MEEKTTEIRKRHIFLGVIPFFSFMLLSNLYIQAHFITLYIDNAHSDNTEIYM